MSVRVVRDCDRCGVHNILKRPIAIGPEGYTADLCTECGFKVLQAVGHQLTPQGYTHALTVINDPKAKSEYNPC